ncbi:putative plant PDR ABC transporter associated [Dioscorea sansibarensis]
MIKFQSENGCSHVLNQFPTCSLNARLVTLGFWISPCSYDELGLTLNEFLAPRWQRVSTKNMALVDQVLISRGLHFKSYFYWVSVGALLGYALLFNVGFTLALSLQRLGVSCAIISCEKFSQMNEGDDLHDGINKSSPGNATVVKRIGKMMALLFQPLAITFQDVGYYVDTPPVVHLSL